jgi:hypothetical protein
VVRKEKTQARWATKIYGARPCRKRRREGLVRNRATRLRELGTPVAQAEPAMLPISIILRAPVRGLGKRTKTDNPLSSPSIGTRTYNALHKFTSLTIFRNRNLFVHHHRGSCVGDSLAQLPLLFSHPSVVFTSPRQLSTTTSRGGNHADQARSGSCANASGKQGA